jgi:hypothetical protein
MTITPSPTDPPVEVTYCRRCRRAVNTHTGPGGVRYLHAVEVRGKPVDHHPDPVPVTEIADPLIECDFCSTPQAVWIYRCADQRTDVPKVTARVVDARDYHKRHHAARALRTESEPALTQAWGEHWSACSDCAKLIEARDKRAVLHLMQPFDSVSMGAPGSPYRVAGACGGWIRLGRRNCLNYVALGASWRR